MPHLDPMGFFVTDAAQKLAARRSRKLECKRHVKREDEIGVGYPRGLRTLHRIHYRRNRSRMPVRMDMRQRNRFFANWARIMWPMDIVPARAPFEWIKIV